MTVVPLAEAASEETFGGKAASLAHALRAGLPVPGGFAISWDCVDAVAGGDRSAIESVVGRWSGERVAVRSSAIGEDSAGASFAGQHLTLLNVVDEEGLIDAVRAIHASAHGDSALAYRKRMGLDGAPKIAIAVVRMIEATAAGVLFTRNPVTGADELVIESAWGLGEAVVSGLVTPDSFRLSPDGQVLERRAGRKDFVIRFASGGGVAERPVPPEDVARLSLSDRQLEQLHALARRCEKHFGNPQDIEWAFEGDVLYLLQSRPITTGPASQPPPRPDGRRLPAEDRLAGTGEAVRDGSQQSLSGRVFTGLALAALLAPLNSTIIAVALPTIGEALSASAALVTRWMVTAYLVVSIIAQSPAGKLADVWGTSRVLTLGRASFGLGALLAAFAPTLSLLGAGRVLMALGGALTIPTVFAQLRNSVPPNRRGRVFGIFGAIMSGAAAAGPLIGGYLTARFGWHSIFLASVPVVLLSFAMVPPRSGDERQGQKPASFDFIGSGILAVAVLLLVGAVERLSLMLSLGTLIAVALFVWRELRADDPVLDVRLFRSREFAAGNAIVALQNLAMYSMVYLLPFVLAQSGYAPSATGRMLLFFTAAMVLASPAGGRLSDSVGSRSIAFLGAIVATAGASLFMAGGHLVASLVLMGAGIGMGTSPSQAAALSAIPASKAGVASGALATMRYTGGVVGGGLVTLIVAGGVERDSRLLVFPAVLILSALAALLLPARR